MVSVAKDLAREQIEREVAQRLRAAAALRRARARAFRDGEDVGQENFMSATEIRALAEATGIRAGGQVLDLCCGTGGPGLLLARDLGCRVLGVDVSLASIRLARSRPEIQALGRRVAFVVADSSSLPLATEFPAVLLLETMLMIEDKARLLQEVGRLLRPNGRFGLTLEAGRPLTEDERRSIPEGESVWLIPEGDFTALVEATDFQICLIEDHTAAHAELAERLTDAYSADCDAIVARLGAPTYDQLITAHRWWVEWLTTRRVRKLALVLERRA